MQFIHIDKYKLSLERYGSEFILITSVEQKNLIPLSEAIYKAELNFTEEVIGTDDEICLKLRSPFNKTSIKQLESIQLDKRSQPNKYILPVHFNDHQDWRAIEDYSRKSREEIIDELIKTNLTFHMHGFLPGFLYISGLPEYLHCPRKATPSKRVEAGTIAIGGPYLGLYSCSSPGGWYSIGRCPLIVFDPSQEPPTSLRHGDTVLLESVSKEAYHTHIDRKLDSDHYG